MCACVCVCVHVCVCTCACAFTCLYVFHMCVYVCECVAVCLLPPSGETVLDHSLYQVDHTLDPALVSQLYHYSTAFLSLSWFFETLYKASQELLEERGGANTQEGTVWEWEGVFVACTWWVGCQRLTHPCTPKHEDMYIHGTTPRMCCMYCNAHVVGACMMPQCMCLRVCVRACACVHVCVCVPQIIHAYTDPISLPLPLPLPPPSLLSPSTPLSLSPSSPSPLPSPSPPPPPLSSPPYVASGEVELLHKAMGAQFHAKVSRLMQLAHCTPPVANHPSPSHCPTHTVHQDTAVGLQEQPSAIPLPSQ